ncbi:energy transducer TonB, partial [Pseudomonas aeruginosa]
MIEEQRRRAFLGAMQITSWLPRQPLPFAAPSRPELLETPPREEPAVPVRAARRDRCAAGPRPASR